MYSTPTSLIQSRIQTPVNRASNPARMPAVPMNQSVSASSGVPSMPAPRPIATPMSYTSAPQSNVSY